MDFHCPRCGTVYHAEERHIGKQIRCTHNNCDELIIVNRQDGSYSHSAQQIRKTRNESQDFVIPKKPHSRIIGSDKNNRKRLYGFASLAILIAAVGLGGYHLGGRRHEMESRRPELVSPVADSPASVSPTPGGTGTTESGSARSQFESGSSRSSDPKQSDVFSDLGFVPSDPKTTRKPSSRTGASSFPKESRSLPTGTRIIPDEATSGDGQLKAINNTHLDACVMVVDEASNKRVRELSVQSESSFLLDHLTPGSYRIVFATGWDWDDRAERFNRDASYFQFGETLDFKQDESSYDRVTITLNVVPNGNVRRRRISEEEFHMLSGKP